MECVETLRRIPAYLADALGAPEAREFRGHLASCPSCRAEAIAREPVLVFSAASPAQADPAETARVLEGVRAGMALRRAERRAGLSSRRGLTAAAGAAALAGLLLWAPRRTARPAAPQGLARPAAAAAAAVRAPAGSWTARPALDSIVPASATVYEWNPTAGKSDSPKIVWIVDRSLDI